MCNIFRKIALHLKINNICAYDEFAVDFGLIENQCQLAIENSILIIVGMYH